MIRLLDISFSFFGILALSPLIITLSLFGVYMSNGSPIFKQSRVGYSQKIFILFKFRTMPLTVKSVGTHLLKNQKLNFYWSFLRLTKLDELLQLFNVLKGDMSLVGPRPCLMNQKKLISERKKRGVLKVRPGITGLAQINGITMQTPTLLAKTDAKMIKQMNLYYYFYYIFMTLVILLKRK